LSDANFASFLKNNMKGGKSDSKVLVIDIVVLKNSEKEVIPQ
jgi:hypothetical protein